MREPDIWDRANVVIREDAAGRASLGSSGGPKRIGVGFFLDLYNTTFAFLLLFNARYGEI